MAPYRRLALHGHPHATRAWPSRSAGRRRITLPLKENAVDPHDAQPMLGLLIGVPLGLACWGALGGIAMGIASLIG